jgi:hypothetical protein
MGAHLAHDCHPGARAHLRIVRGKIGARHREIEGRQAVAFVLGVRSFSVLPPEVGLPAPTCALAPAEPKGFESHRFGAPAPRQR